MVMSAAAPPRVSRMCRHLHHSANGLQTGRYAFRWGATAYTIGSPEPWGVPLDETFFPELLQASEPSQCQ